MADYSNPQIPDGINVSHTYPLVDFARLLGGILVVLVATVLLLALLAGRLAKYLPFEAEASIAHRFVGKLAAPGAQPIAAYLSTLARRLAAAHALPPGMTITVHYRPEDTVNAYATLGGHVVVYDGLLRRLPNENALAMVISHEIAHVRLRHPISSMGRGIMFGIALGVVSSAVGADVVGQALGPAGLLTLLRFSREQESEADAAGLAAVVAVYGHAGGSSDTFRALSKSVSATSRPPEWLSTHPFDETRIAAIEAAARARGWAADGPVTPYPREVAAALSFERGNDATP
ncbi:MAG: M48 family metalloprotease [Betaproteobacteria bacterium]